MWSIDSWKVVITDASVIAYCKTLNGSFDLSSNSRLWDASRFLYPNRRSQSLLECRNRRDVHNECHWQKWWGRWCRSVLLSQLHCEPRGESGEGVKKRRHQKEPATQAITTKKKERRGKTCFCWLIKSLSRNKTTSTTLSSFKDDYPASVRLATPQTCVCVYACGSCQVNRSRSRGAATAEEPVTLSHSSHVKLLRLR